MESYICKYGSKISLLDMSNNMHTSPLVSPFPDPSLHLSGQRRKRPLDLEDNFPHDIDNSSGKRFHSLRFESVNPLAFSPYIPPPRNQRKRNAEVDLGMLDPRDPTYLRLNNTIESHIQEKKELPPVLDGTEHVFATNLPISSDPSKPLESESSLLKAGQSIVPVIDLSSYSTSAQIRSLMRPTPVSKSPKSPMHSMPWHNSNSNHIRPNVGDSNADMVDDDDDSNEQNSHSPSHSHSPSSSSYYDRNTALILYNPS
jgi:hypothetical protein